MAWIEFAFHQAKFTLPPMIQPHNSHQKQEFACSQALSELPQGLVKHMLTLMGFFLRSEQSVPLGFSRAFSALRGVCTCLPLVDGCDLVRIFSLGCVMRQYYPEKCGSPGADLRLAASSSSQHPHCFSDGINEKPNPPWIAFLLLK